MISIATIIGVLKKIKPIYILAILLILMSIVAYSFMLRSQYHKSESERKGNNFTELQNFNKEKIASMVLNSKEEMEGFINSREDMKALYEKQLEDKNIKIKQITSIVFQKQEYINNLEQSTNISTIIEYIKKDVDTFLVWKDSVPCLEIEGKIVYKNDSLYNIITKREYHNDMMLTGYWERPQKNIFTRWFGRPNAHATVVNTCGETKSILIKKKNEKFQKR